MPTASIPNRPVFRAQEVCDLAEVQAYVLRSWEAEFPDLGVAKTPNGPRVYRRADVERVLRIKQLLFDEGLTLAGARRRLSDEGVVVSTDEPVQDADVAAMIDDETRQQLRDVRRGLTWILGVLSGQAATADDFVLTAEVGQPRRITTPAKRGTSTPPSRGKAASPRKPLGGKKR